MQKPPACPLTEGADSHTEDTQTIYSSEYKLSFTSALQPVQKQPACPLTESAHIHTEDTQTIDPYEYKLLRQTADIHICLPSPKSTFLELDPTHTSAQFYSWGSRARNCSFKINPVPLCLERAVTIIQL